MPKTLSNKALRACHITLRGKVQGLGVRPAIARLARRLQLAGSVSNSSRGVSIRVEGSHAHLQLFRDTLEASLPRGSMVESINSETCHPLGHSAFRIEPSSSGGPLQVQVPPDVAVCSDCLADVAAGDNRRHEYLLTTCTGCGPRYSIIEAMPYDRAGSSMSRFTMCARCRDEYASDRDRRFHSQTNSCVACGPRNWLADMSNRVVAHDEHALEPAAAALRSGKILALRGVGGYQLLVDAASESAVCELRRRKRRHGKPLAVMIALHADADALATIDPLEHQALCASSNPIVVLARRESAGLAPAVCAGFDTVGLMLPTTALHESLSRAVRRPLVVTSGNTEGDPLEFSKREFSQPLSDLADVCLDHDRPIVRPVDDSVVRVIAGRAATIRLARGLAPLPLEFESPFRIIALGGHQKAAIALANGAQTVLGPHVGDLDSEASRRRYLEHLAAMQQLYGFTPQLLVHDDHPDYFTTQWAARQPVETMAVQHHHAHVVAGMIEHGWLNREVLGVAWDGTGYGPDGTVWGGEFLVATAARYRRVAHLRPFSLPGGETAVREPWRVAVSLVCETLGPEAAASLRFDGVAATPAAAITQILQRSNLCPRTSSAGRLFDGIAALILGATHAQFEGQPALLLESACDPSTTGQYEMAYVHGQPGILDWRPLVCAALADFRAAVSPGAIAMRFHRALANGIASVAHQFFELPIVLGGGCFSNRVLTELVAEALTARGRQIATPGVVPVGDGGLAAGQLAVANARLEGGWRPCA
jgi:hydrogenase maturation protein HypF